MALYRCGSLRAMDAALVYWLFVVSVGGLAIGGIGSAILFVLFALKIAE